MKFFPLKKLNKERSNWTVLALAICFSLLSLFGSPLHDHDLNSSHLDLDCIACHLVHSNVSLKTDTAELSLHTQVTQWIATVAAVSIASAPLIASSRAPPVNR